MSGSLTPAQQIAQTIREDCERYYEAYPADSDDLGWSSTWNMAEDRIAAAIEQRDKQWAEREKDLRDALQRSTDEQRIARIEHYLSTGGGRCDRETVQWLISKLRERSEDTERLIKAASELAEEYKYTHSLAHRQPLWVALREAIDAARAGKDHTR